MARRIGTIGSLFRYPVKSMAGVSVDAAVLGWHGVEGDRRLAFRRVDERSGFPWLTASRLAELVLHQPFGASDGDALAPTHVRTPDGRELPLAGDELREALSRRFGGPLELMRLDRGIFDDAPVSVIAAATIREVSSRAGQAADVRRFRPNVLVDTEDGVPFAEDAWIGKRLRFGDGEGPTVAVTHRDVRCVMISLDPDTAESNPEMLKTAVRLNENCAGIYGSVLRTGELRVGQPVFLDEVHPTSAAMPY